MGEQPRSQLLSPGGKCDRIDRLMLDRTWEIVAGIPVPEREILLHSLRLLNRAMERPAGGHRSF
jgi:hypothetical protein